jgi:hypothetical protein
MGWRRADDADREGLARWLVERAVEHDAPATLSVLVAEHLRARQVLRPPVDTLARMIATARAEAQSRGRAAARRRRAVVDDDRPAVSSPRSTSAESWFIQPG